MELENGYQERTSRSGPKAGEIGAASLALFCVNQRPLGHGLYFVTVEYVLIITKPRMSSYILVSQIYNQQFGVPLAFLSSAVAFLLYRLCVAAVLWFDLFVLK